MKSLKTVLALALAAALVLSLNLTAFAESLPIGIPDDGTNLSRGIKLLETAGLITVDPEAGYTPEIADITGYLYDVEVTPVQANTLPSTLADFGASTINSFIRPSSRPTRPRPLPSSCWSTTRKPSIPPSSMMKRSA